MQISDSSGTDATLPSPANLVPAFTPASQMQLQTAPTQPIKKPTGSYSNPETRNTPAPAPSYAALTSVERPVSEHGPAPAIPAAESIPKKDNKKAEVKKAISLSMAPGQPRVDPLPGPKKKKPKNCNPKIPVAANLSLPNGCEWWDVMHKKFVVDIQVPTTTLIASFFSALTCCTPSIIFALSTYIRALLLKGRPMRL